MSTEFTTEMKASYHLTRADLVRYAGASGDFNPIHWSDRVATAVGLPGVIAHGMLTMGLMTRAVAEWTGDAEVVEVGGRFTSMVQVPDDDLGAEVSFTGTVRSSDGDLTTIAVEATCGGQKILGNPTVVVRAAL